MRIRRQCRAEMMLLFQNFARGCTSPKAMQPRFDSERAGRWSGKARKEPDVIWTHGIARNHSAERLDTYPRRA